MAPISKFVFLFFLFCSSVFANTSQPLCVRLLADNHSLAQIAQDAYEKLLNKAGADLISDNDLTIMIESQDPFKLNTDSNSDKTAIQNGFELLKRFVENNVQDQDAFKNGLLAFLQEKYTARAIENKKQNEITAERERHSPKAIFIDKAHSQPIVHIELSPTEDVFFTRPMHYSIRMWNATTGDFIRDFRIDANERITASAISKNGAYLAIASTDDIVSIWDIKTGLLHKQREFKRRWIGGLGFSIDENGDEILAMAYDKRIEYWHNPTPDFKSSRITRLWRSLLRIFKKKNFHIWRPASPKTISAHSGKMSPDGNFFAFTDGDRTSLIRIPTRKPFFTNKVSTVVGQNMVAFSQDEKYAALHSRRYAQVINLETGDSELIYTGLTPSQCLALSSDATYLVSGNNDGSIKIWNVAKGHLEGTITAHAASVNSMHFTHDGQRLITVSDDRSVKLWNFEDLLGH